MKPVLLSVALDKLSVVQGQKSGGGWRGGFEHGALILNCRLVSLHLNFKEKQKSRKRSTVNEIRLPERFPSQRPLPGVFRSLIKTKFIRLTNICSAFTLCQLHSDNQPMFLFKSKTAVRTHNTHVHSHAHAGTDGTHAHTRMHTNTFAERCFLFERRARSSRLWIRASPEGNAKILAFFWFRFYF